jgi:maleylacetoacetate isomerase
MILYSYFRSSAAYRVRIALNLKELDYDIKPVHLLNGGGQQHLPEYHLLNPLELVPVLSHKNLTISQSLVIIDYLDEIKESPALYPASLTEKIACKEFALSIACDVHPINNLRVMNFLKKQHGLNPQQIKDWNLNWINIAFEALEEKLNHQENSHAFCFGNQASVADICLIPQVYNGLRHDINMSQYPRLDRIYQHCITLPAFKKAAPEHQPDATN